MQQDTEQRVLSLHNAKRAWSWRRAAAAMDVAAPPLARAVCAVGGHNPGDGAPTNPNTKTKGCEGPRAGGGFFLEWGQPFVRHRASIFC